MFTVNLPNDNDSCSISSTQQNKISNESSVAKYRRRQPRKNAKFWKNWTCNDVSLWLKNQLRWPDTVVKQFYEEEVNGEVLPTLTQNDLQELGVVEVYQSLNY